MDELAKNSDKGNEGSPLAGTVRTKYYKDKQSIDGRGTVKVLFLCKGTVSYNQNLPLWSPYTPRPSLGLTCTPFSCRKPTLGWEEER